MAVITISRQYGTGGMTMGNHLADRLGYKFVFREELARGCRERGLDIDLDRMEGRAPNVIERLFGVNPETLRRSLKETMEEAARAGGIVIGGWGGQVLFKDRPDALHVRVVGSKEARIRQLMESGGVSRSAAESITKSADRDQKLFSEYFFEVDFANPKLYHAVLNTETFSHDGMIDLILAMLREKKLS
ncbi:MAG: cytidylate kinase-like family protein [Candidatus Tectomicrobia bacterium]|nr:cytidylate kinase-like family protein [Candidatus Tectomicrobia bacterium]